MSKNTLVVLMAIIAPFLISLIVVILDAHLNIHVGKLYLKAPKWTNYDLPMLILEFIPSLLLVVFFMETTLLKKIGFFIVMLVTLQIPMIFSYLFFGCAIGRNCL